MTWKWIIATICYMLSLLLYAIACIYYGSAEMHLDIFGVFFSVIPAYIILFWSLDEARKGTNEQIKALQKLTSEQISALKECTQRQIDSFSVQCQGIVSAIEQVIGEFGKMSEENRKRAEQEEKRLEILQKQTENNLRTMERESQKTFEEKQRIAPRVFVRIADEMWWFFFRHYQLYVYNSGGILNNMELTYFFSRNASYKTVEQQRSIGLLNREQGSGAIDCGDVSAFSAYTAIQVSVSLRDRKDRLYVGSVTIDKSDREWTQIPLEERPGE
jgi:hypothetical protein